MADVKFWTNRGWIVDVYGLRSIDKTYFIPASSLSRLLSAETPAAAWPVEIAERDDVEFDDFMEAFRHALAFHKGRYPAFPPGAYDEALRLILMAELARGSK